MKTVREKLKTVFNALNERIIEINRQRSEDGLAPMPVSEVKLLGQMSLLVNEKTSLILSLAQTNDMDALLVMDHLVKEELKKILQRLGFIYDEDSYLVWIPSGAKFETLLDYDHVVVSAIDPESALVSKAVKAPERNKQLIREAIASAEFKGLVDRILENGGKLENFT